MRTASPPKRRARAFKWTATATAAAVGAVLLTTPGTASAQTEIDCSALGDNPMASGMEAALEAAVACDVEVRIEERSGPYETVSVTPQGRLHLVSTVGPVQEHLDQGNAEATLIESDGFLVQANSPWQFFLGHTGTSQPLIRTKGADLNWNGETPVPVYSGTTAVYDEMAAGLDLTVDAGVSSADLRFTIDDVEAWNQLSSGLNISAGRAFEHDLYIQYPREIGEPGTWEATSRFMVRDFAGVSHPAALTIGEDGTITVSPPDGFLDTAVFPLTLSTQWAYRKYGVHEWGAVTSASPELSIFRGEAGLDQPYFEAAGQSSDAVVGAYCDALVDPECSTTSEAAVYWNFWSPLLGGVRPSTSYAFSYPVTSATFEVDAAEGSTCVAPELQHHGIYGHHDAWNGRPAESGSPISGACQDGTAVYDVTESAFGSSPSRVLDTFGMTESPETARFDGGSARFEVYFDIVGFNYTGPSSSGCGRFANSPAFTGSSSLTYGGFLVDTWRPDLLDLGLTWTAIISDSDTDETVVATEPTAVDLGDRTGTSVISGMDDGQYSKEYEFSSTTTGFNYQSSCHEVLDTVEPEVVDMTVQPGPRYVGDTAYVDVKVSDALFPDGVNSVTVRCFAGAECRGQSPVVLKRDDTATFELEMDGTHNKVDFWLTDEAGNSYFSEEISFPATYSRNDYDGDGNQDLVVVRKSDGYLMFHAGRGDGTFENGVAVGSGWEKMDVVMAGDLTGDGLADLLARNTRTGYLYTYAGNGDGGFPYSDRVTVGSGWNKMASFTSVGDLGTDGKADLLALGRTDGNLYSYNGLGDGTFDDHNGYSTAFSGIGSITAIGDVGGSGSPDLLAQDSRTGEYYVYFGYGSGYFADRVAIDASLVDSTQTRRYSQFSAVGDLDSDGRGDVVAVDSQTGELVVHSFDEDGSALHSGQVVGTSWNTVRLPAVASDRTYDYDGDGATDTIARRASDGNLYFYPGAVSGFGSRSLMGASWGSMNLIETAGDMSGDGFADILARHASTGVLYLYPGDGRGDYAFSERITVGTGWGSMSAIVGGHDYDNDGIADVIARTRSSGNLYLYPGTGGGKLGQRELIGTGWNPMREITAVGDLDHDGHSDIIAVQESDGCLYFYGGRGDGHLKSRVQMGCGWNTRDSLAGVGDFDGDGHADWVARRPSDGSLLLYPGDGRGDYDYSRSIALGTGWNSMNAIA